MQLGSIYALIALGYTMVYGVLKLINFAHGDVYMVGAYAGLGAANVGMATVLGGGVAAFLHMRTLVPSWLGAILVLLAAMLLCALILGLVIEQAAYRPLRTRAWIAPAVFLGAAVGLCRLRDRAELEPDARLVGRHRRPRMGGAGGPPVHDAAAARFGQRLAADRADHGHRRLAVPGELRRPQADILVHPRFFPPLVALSPTVENVLIFGVSVTLMVALTYIVTRTRVGKAIRAVSFDADAAALMGINTDRVIAFTFMLGAALAGAAGVLVFGLQHTHFDPYVGILYGLKAFVAAVLGGIGNIPGAVLGGIIMGLAETLVVAYGPRIGIDSTYRDAVAFLLLIVILLFRPAGLLGSLMPSGTGEGVTGCGRHLPTGTALLRTLRLTRPAKARPLWQRMGSVALVVAALLLADHLL